MSAKAQQGQPAPFLRKTYDIVDDESSQSIISWSPSGLSFVVWKPAEFARDLLPLYFKHNNFSSFVRQLNTYGFRKVDPDKWEFASDGFVKGQRDLLASIQRRKATPAARPSGGNNGPTNNHPSDAAMPDLPSSSYTATATPASSNVMGSANSAFSKPVRQDHVPFNNEIHAQGIERAQGAQDNFPRAAPQVTNRSNSSGKISHSKDGTTDSENMETDGDVEETTKGSKRTRDDLYRLEVAGSDRHMVDKDGRPLPAGVTRPVPTNLGNQTSALLSEFAGQLHRLSHLALEVEGLKEENTKLRHDMAVLNQVNVTTPQGTAGANTSAGNPGIQYPVRPSVHAERDGPRRDSRREPTSASLKTSADFSRAQQELAIEAKSRHDQLVVAQQKQSQASHALEARLALQERAAVQGEERARALQHALVQQQAASFQVVRMNQELQARMEAQEEKHKQQLDRNQRLEARIAELEHQLQDPPSDAEPTKPDSSSQDSPPEQAGILSFEGLISQAQATIANTDADNSDFPSGKHLQDQAQVQEADVAAAPVEELPEMDVAPTSLEPPGADVPTSLASADNVGTLLTADGRATADMSARIWAALRELISAAPDPSTAMKVVLQHIAPQADVAQLQAAIPTSSPTPPGTQSPAEMSLGTGPRTCSLNQWPGSGTTESDSAPSESVSTMESGATSSAQQHWDAAGQSRQQLGSSLPPALQNIPASVMQQFAVITGLAGRGASSSGVQNSPQLLLQQLQQLQQQQLQQRQQQQQEGNALLPPPPPLKLN